MNEWMDEFISQCLADIPWGKYRARTEKELRDHMETLRQSMTEAEVLQRMGDPEQLREEYRSTWERTAWTERFATIAIGCVTMGMLYIMTAMVLSTLGFTYDGVSAHPHTLTGRNFPILEGGLSLAIFGTALFFVPFTLGALYLRRCFLGECHPVFWVTAGLLAAWAGEKTAIISLSAFIYEMPLSLDLLHRISRGGDVTGPWFTSTYILLTFIGCLVLGRLFGRKTERRRELS